MGKYQAYPSYILSGIFSTPEMPNNWISGKVKYVTESLDKIRIPLSSEERGDRKGDYPYYGASGIIDYVNDYLFDEDTILFGEDGANLIARSSPLAFLAVGKYWVNNHAHILKTKDGINKYWVMCLENIDVTTVVSGSAQPKLTAEALGDLQIVYPQSISEREKIANFLDHETAKIDTLIEKQQQLIKLLKEKRQAVISHAVTKGLNPNAPMRDSGVEWLGEVPEEWIVSKFNYEIDFLEGPGILAYDFFEEGVPLLRIQNVKEEFVTDNYKTYLSPSKVLAKWDHFRVELGDLIISCSASTGLVSEVDSRCVGAIPYTGLIRLRPLSSRICKSYIYYIVQSDMFFEQINVLQTGSTMQHFGPYHLQQMYVTLPSMDEQNIIVEQIKKNVADINRLVEKANQAVELMQERRTALISAAVTGKIDVRNWHTPEPSNTNNKNVVA